MKIGLTTTGKYTIAEGSDILCQCSTLTEASAVLLYLSMKPITVLERGIARTAILNWDNEIKSRQEQKAAKKARQKANRKAKKLSQTEKTPVDPEEEIVVPALPEV